MNLQELIQTLPNGLHDAELRSMAMDFVGRRLTCLLEVWIGDLDDPARREVYRSACLAFEGVAYLVMEPPDGRDPWLRGESVTIDAGIGDPADSPFHGLELPAGHFRAYLYLSDLNAFVRLAAQAASIEWTGREVQKREACRGSAR
jgi:hypothetical protein